MVRIDIYIASTIFESCIVSGSETTSAQTALIVRDTDYYPIAAASNNLKVYIMEGNILERVQEEKDLGVMVH